MRPDLNCTPRPSPRGGEPAPCTPTVTSTPRVVSGRRAPPRLVALVALGAAIVASCSSSDETLAFPAPELDASSSNPRPELQFDDAGLPTGSACPPDGSLTYASFAKPFFSTYCTRCHGTDKVGMAERNGAPDDYNFDTLAGVRRLYKVIDSVAAAGPLVANDYMPLTDPKPTEGERRQLGSWLACREAVPPDGGAR